MADADPIQRLNAVLEGRYRIERELGAGGMATVYLADDLKHDRKVAIKVLRPELAAVVGAERFLAEIKTTANLQHPHILPLFDSGEADGFLFYVMPYVEGESLRERLERERQLPVDEAVALAWKIADALDYAHERGVVHRDIKPANVLLSERGEPLVADFGIALAVSQAGGGRITETGLSMGTPHYMSPEQAAGDRTVDRRSDIYALGCVLYEMLAGEPPYGGGTAQSVLAKILTEEPRRVAAVRRSVPGHVEAAVARALEKLPADRFASASVFREALADEAFRHEPAGEATGAPSAPDSAGARARARRVPLVGAVGAGAVVLTALAAFAVGRSTAISSGDIPVTRFSIDSGEHPVRGAEFDLSPDGRTLVYAPETGGPLYLRKMGELEVRPIPGTEGGANPAFSPDGEWIAFTTSDALLKVSVSGGPPLRITSTEEQGCCLHWGDAGFLVYMTLDGISRVPEQGGEPERVLEGAPFTLRFPRLLPGGERLLFSRIPLGQSTGTVELLDLATGEATTLVEEGSDARYVESGHLVYGHASQALFAAPFDLESGQIEGPPFPVLSGVRVVPGFGAAAFRVSRTGTAVYVTGGGTADRATVLLLDGAGNREPVPLAPGDLRQPELSPDGGRLAYSDQEAGQIFVYDFVLGTNTQMTFEGLNLVPRWSPGGDSLVFVNYGDSQTGDMYWVPASGGEEARPLWSSSTLDLPQSFSPDGSRLLFMVVEGGNADLHVLELGGTPEATPYLQANWAERNGRISPDGRWAAYESDEEGSFEIFVRAFPRPSGKTKVSEGGGQVPRWSPDGGRLYYWTGDTLMAATVQTEPPFQVLSRSRVLVDDQYDNQGSYDVRPDGSGFVIFGRGGDEEDDPEEDADPTGLVGVVNWFEELRRRAGGEEGSRPP